MLLKSCEIVQYKTKIYSLQWSLGKKVTSYTTFMIKTQLGKKEIHSILQPLPPPLPPHFVVEAFRKCK
jgi:hypothetical protein